MDYAANTFREITEGQLGLKSMLLFENESYKAMAAFGASRLMALSMAGARGVSIQEIGNLLARAQAMQKMGSYDYVKNAGLSAEYLRESGKLYNEASKMGIRKALDEIAATGHLSRETQKLLMSIGQDPIGRAVLATQGIGDRIIKPEEAEHFREWYASQGISVDAGKLAGATAQMNVWADKRGGLHSSLLATKAGVALAKYRSDKTVGWSGSFAGYEFLSATRTNLGGGMVSIKGVTRDGKSIDLIGSTAGGNEEIASEIVKQGPSYTGTLVMAERGEVPTKVFHDREHSAIFAQTYANEVSKLYRGTMSKRESLLHLNEGLEGYSGLVLWVLLLASALVNKP